MFNRIYGLCGLFKYIDYKARQRFLHLYLIGAIFCMSNVLIWTSPKRLQVKPPMLGIEKENEPLWKYFDVKMLGEVNKRISFEVKIKDCYQKDPLYRDLEANCHKVLFQTFQTTVDVLKQSIESIILFSINDSFSFINNDIRFIKVRRDIINFLQQRKVYDNIKDLEELIQASISGLNYCIIKLVKADKEAGMHDDIQAVFLKLLLHLKNITQCEHRAWNLSYNQLQEQILIQASDKLSSCNIRYFLLPHPTFAPDVVYSQDDTFASTLKELLVAMQSLGALLKDNVYLRNLFYRTSIRGNSVQQFYWTHVMGALCLQSPGSKANQVCFGSIKSRLFEAEALCVKDMSMYYPLDLIANDLTSYFEVFNIWACSYLQITARVGLTSGRDVATNYIDAYQRWLNEVKNFPTSRVYQQVLTARRAFFNPKLWREPQAFVVLNYSQLDEFFERIDALYFAFTAQIQYQQRWCEAFLITDSLQTDEQCGRKVQDAAEAEAWASLQSAFEQGKKLLRKQEAEQAFRKTKLEKTQTDLVLLLGLEPKLRETIARDAETELNNLACSLQRRLIRSLVFNAQQDNEDQDEEAVDEEEFMEEAAYPAKYSIICSSEAERDLEKIDRSVMARIEQQLSLDPLRDCHTVLGHIGNDTYRRIRCGDYRAIYCVKDEIVIIEGVFKRNFQTYGPRCLGRCVKKSLA